MSLVLVMATSSKRTAAAAAMAASGSKMNKHQASNGKPPMQHFKFWPSRLICAGHTTSQLNDPEEPLYQFLAQVQPADAFEDRRHSHGSHGAQRSLLFAYKFRHGTDRWWCAVHQGAYGKKDHLQMTNKTGVKCCEHADDPVDFCRVQDIPSFCPLRQHRHGKWQLCSKCKYKL
jgi:hypothetical protein